LVVVCHGQGRGRQAEAARRILHRATANVPWRDRLIVHETATQPPPLDRVAAVVFWLADPLRELYPDCFAEASRLAAEARRRGIRVVQPPAALSNTIKSVQAALWQAAGIPCAPAIAFGSAAELEALLPAATYPVIVRPDHLHGQQAAVLCAERAAAVAAARGIGAGVLLPFIDTRAGYRHTRPRSVWARYYHKKRAFVFGEMVVPNHVFFSAHPICGRHRSTFARYDGGRWRWSWTVHFRPAERAALAADLAFASGSGECHALLRRAVQVLGLDFAAIDYALDADGAPVLWEANPYFDLPDPESGAMPRERRLQARIAGFDRAIGGFLGGLIGV
jgi:hypothetical protein